MDTTAENGKRPCTVARVSKDKKKVYVKKYDSCGSKNEHNTGIFNAFNASTSPDTAYAILFNGDHENDIKKDTSWIIKNKKEGLLAFVNGIVAWDNGYSNIRRILFNDDETELDLSQDNSKNVSKDLDNKDDTTGTDHDVNSEQKDIDQNETQGGAANPPENPENKQKKKIAPIKLAIRQAKAAIKNVQNSESNFKNAELKVLNNDEKNTVETGLETFSKALDKTVDIMQKETPQKRVAKDNKDNK